MRRTRAALAATAFAMGFLVLGPAAMAAPAGQASPGASAPTVGSGNHFNQVGDLLISDRYSNRVIEVNPLTKAIVWCFGSDNATLGNPGPAGVSGPNDAERLSGGLTLIAGTGVPSSVAGTMACVDNRVFVVNPAGHIVWQFSQGILTAALASRLSNGDTPITDVGHNRVVEVTHDKTVVFQYFTNHSAASNASPTPTNAVRIGGGDTIISDQLNNRVTVIDASKHVVFQYGKTNEIGQGFDELFGPYSAYEIGDYTGQTTPPRVF